MGLQYRQVQGVAHHHRVRAVGRVVEGVPCMLGGAAGHQAEAGVARGVPREVLQRGDIGVDTGRGAGDSHHWRCSSGRGVDGASIRDVK